MKKRIGFLILLVSAASSVLTAGTVDSSKEVAAVQTPPEKDWSFTLSPYGWMTSINGTISAGGRSAEIDIDFDQVLKHLDMTFMMSAQVRYKRWGFTGDLIYARLATDVAPPRGLLFSNARAVLRETIGTFALSYRVVESPKGALDVFAGGRVYSIYSQIRLFPRFAPRGVNVSGTETWADPIIGLSGRYYVTRPVFLHLYGDVGGFGVGSDISWQVLGGVGVRASHWCDLELGYRALGFEYDPGRSQQDITTHGPIIGAIFHF